MVSGASCGKSKERPTSEVSITYDGIPRFGGVFLWQAKVSQGHFDLIGHLSRQDQTVFA